MALVNLKQILMETRDKRYAVPSVGADNHVLFEAILKEAESENKPVILMIPGFLLKDMDPRFFEYARLRIIQSSVPVCLHLDHAASYEECMNGIKYGFTSLMIDGSALSFEENVALTKRVVEAAAPCGISVEAEIGHVAGGEGNNNDGNEVDVNAFTDPDEAQRFVEETGVDALAIAFGTVHGIYKGEPKLKLELLDEVRERVDIPIVMHGGSGLSDEDFRNAVAHGISKINFCTGLFLSTTEAARAAIAEHNNKMQLPAVLGVIERAARKEISHLFDVYHTQPIDLGNIAHK
ncbi:MAG TPA: class II fructose-bisphosphate aldolase [Candidatus Mediterraneibacter merdipullorum]|nr:class II fructose-bisphosphate aldolase [Candidatus Mediterraneibacter merdipullorum]